MIFRDRHDAADRLAAQLADLAHQPDTVVLALPRGGMAVAARVAQTLGLPLDVLVVRTLGYPVCPGVPMGALASGGAIAVATHAALPAPSDEDLEAVAVRESVELARAERLYREGREPLALDGQTVVLVDEGLATPACMHAAVRAAWQHGAARVVVAVPVGELCACEALRKEVDDLRCVHMPDRLLALAAWYRHLPLLSDEHAVQLMRGPLQPA